MTFDQWAATCPSMSVTEREIARLAWDAAIKAAIQHMGAGGTMMLEHLLAA